MLSWMRATTVLAAIFFVAPVAHADSPPALPADAPLTLRPAERLEPLAEAVARTLSLRMDVPVSVGGPPPPSIPEAVPAGHLAMTRHEGTVHLALAGPEGQVFWSEVPIGRARGTAAVRTVALAIELLREAALDGPPGGTAISSTRRTFELRGQTVTWSYLEREGGLFGPRESSGVEATSLFYLGASLGVSTERSSAMVGPRLGLALCLHEVCLALEGDVPILPDESTACDGRGTRYRPVTLGLRLSMQPIVIDRALFFGFSFGLLSRFGIVSLADVEVSRLATDFGLRAGVQIAWRIAPLLELAVEIGADAHVAPSRFVRSSRPPPEVDCPTLEAVLVEDFVTPWTALVIRLRP